jgi:hypothetical protein
MVVATTLLPSALRVSNLGTKNQKASFVEPRGVPLGSLIKWRKVRFRV